MKVKFFVFDVLMKGDIVEKECEVRNGADYFKKKQRFAKETGVKVRRVQDNLSPFDYLVLTGKHFGDRED